LRGDEGAVVGRRLEGYVRNGGRKNASADGQYATGNANGFREIAGNVRERGEKEVAEIMSFQPVARAETKLKQPAEQRFVFGEGHHAVADVPRGEDTILAAQAAGAAAVVGDGDDCGEVHDGALCGRIGVVARHNVKLEPAE